MTVCMHYPLSYQQESPRISGERILKICSSHLRQLYGPAADIHILRVSRSVVGSDIESHCRSFLIHQPILTPTVALSEHRSRTFSMARTPGPLVQNPYAANLVLERLTWSPACTSHLPSQPCPVECLRACDRKFISHTSDEYIRLR